MTTLDPKLDKLRNKDLIAGCIVEGYVYDGVDYRRDTLVKLHCSGYALLSRSGKTWDGGSVSKPKEHAVIGHPLTWGRIEYLSNGRGKYTEEGFDDNRFNSWQDIATLLDTDPRLYDQTEIERQQHEKRPELRELLVKFAEYI